MTVYAVWQEKYGQTEGDKTVTTTFGSAVEQGLSAYMAYGGTTTAADKFTYEIKSGNDNGYFSIDGDKLKVSSTTPAATYNLTITATEKAPQISTFAANSLGTSPVDISVTVIVSPKTIEAAIIGSIAAQIYTGSELTPAVTVSDGDKELTKDADYTLAYSNNINAGTADVEVKGTGNYTGTATKQFTIEKTDQAAPDVAIDYEEETFSTTTDMEWSTDSTNWTACTNNMNVSACGWDGSVVKTVSFRLAEDGNHNPGQTVNVTIPARPAAPDTALKLTKTADSITITNPDARCEYSIDGTAWNDETFTSLTAGKDYAVQVRFKATATAFRSAANSQTVTTVNEGGSTTLKPGETVTTEDGVTITNNGGTVTTETGGTTTTITPPDSGNIDVGDDGTITVPGGSTIQTGEDGPQITTGDEGGAVGGDGSVTVPGGSSVTIPDSEGGKATITVPEGGEGTLAPAEGGKVEIPGGSTVEPEGGPKMTLPEGSTVNPDGTITVPGGKVTMTTENGETITITIPEGGGTIKPTEDGKIEVPGGSTVQTGDDTPIPIPSTGGSASTGGEIKYDVTVTFEPQNDTPATSQTVPVGGKATKPSDPVRNGYTFDGWYTDADGTTAWDFDTAVTGSMTLYAKWTVKYIGGGDIGGGSSSDKPTVTIGGNGEGGKAETGQNGTVTITPEDGYEIVKITVNGKEVEIPADGKLTGLKRTDKVEVTFGEVTTPVSQRFNDVTAGAWYEDAVQFAVDNGLFYGTSDTTFSPNHDMTRGMLATVLYRLAKEPGTSADGLFGDVADGMYYTEAIAWAAENGIVTGYGAGLFGPDDSITREQLATILWRYAGSPASNGTLNGFTDVDKVDVWAEDALRWAVENKIVNGKGNGILDPTGKATRAEVAAMLMRYCDTLE